MGAVARWPERTFVSKRVSSVPRTRERPMLRPEEEWARQLIARALGRPVEQHDDGSKPGMHDLDVIQEADRSAVEVTMAADAESTEVWNIMNGTGGRWQVPGIEGGWMVSITPSARAKRLITELPGLLGRLENEGLTGLLRRNSRQRSPLRALAESLGIVSAFKGGTSFPGSIYVTLDLPAERTGGYAAQNGNALAEWIGQFLGADARADVRRKLAASGYEERHAFVILPPLADAPFSVTEVLLRDDAPLPTIPPDLPKEVTHVWVVSGWSGGYGIRWTAQGGWVLFDKRGVGLDDSGLSPSPSA